LQGAYLQDANLQDANLQGAYLYCARLLNANLLNANLQGVEGMQVFTCMWIDRDNTQQACTYLSRHAAETKMCEMLARKMCAWVG